MIKPQFIVCHIEYTAFSSTVCRFIACQRQPYRYSAFIIYEYHVERLSGLCGIVNTVTDKER